GPPPPPPASWSWATYAPAGPWPAGAGCAAPRCSTRSTPRASRGRWRRWPSGEATHLPPFASALRRRAGPPRLQPPRPLRPRPAPARGAGPPAGRGLLVPERPLLPRQTGLRAGLPAAAGGPARRARDHAHRRPRPRRRAGGLRAAAALRRGRHRRRQRALHGAAAARRAAPGPVPRRSLRCGAARQHRHRQVSRAAPRHLRRASALSRGLRGPRRHESGRTAAPLRARRGRARVHRCGGRGAPRAAAATAGARAMSPRAAGTPPAPVPAAEMIPADRDTVELRLGARAITLTNLRKPFWTRPTITKGDLLRYYATVSPYLLPHLHDRAMVMKRYPDGAAGSSFFMKRAPPPHPEWIETCSIRHSSGSVIDFPMVQDLLSLLWVVNLGCIDLHQWYARCDAVHP